MSHARWSSRNDSYRSRTKGLGYTLCRCNLRRRMCWTVGWVERGEEQAGPSMPAMRCMDKLAEMGGRGQQKVAKRQGGVGTGGGRCRLVRHLAIRRWVAALAPHPLTRCD